MARKKIVTKKSQKDDLDPTKDQFVTRSISVLDWLVDRRRQIGLLLVVALIAAIAGIVIDRLMQSRNEDASALLGKGLEAATAEVVPPRDDEIPAEEDEGERLTFETRGARATEALKRFDETVKEQGTSVVGRLAELGIADAHFDLGEYDEAIAAYQAFLADAKDDVAWLRVNATEGLGHALEAAGKLDEARAKFKELADQETGRVALLARYEEARIANQLEDKNAATELLKEVMKGIVDDTENSYDRLDYLFVQASDLLLTLDPEADVPSLPGGGFGGLEGIDPALLQQLIRAQQGAGG